MGALTRVALAATVTALGCDSLHDPYGGGPDAGTAGDSTPSDAVAAPSDAAAAPSDAAAAPSDAAAAPSDAAATAPSDWLYIDEGTRLNGVDVPRAAPELRVARGAAITGTVRLEVRNLHRPEAVVSVVYTPDWGDHATSFRTALARAPTGRTYHDVPIDLTAPASPGTWHLVFGSAGQTAPHYVASVTQWLRGESVWDDGNDLADLGDEALLEARRRGFLVLPELATDGVAHTVYGVASIRLVVE